MHNQKNACRKQIRASLSSMSEEEHTKSSLVASEHLLASALWEKSAILCLFVSYGTEIETRYLLTKAWEQQKKVYLPRCFSLESGIMDFFLCSGMDDLAVGAYGILEPRDSIVAQGALSLAPDMLLVPGLAFTLTGQRMGKGGGYYDRFMAREMCQTSQRVGFGFSRQIVPSIPIEPWDVPLHFLCTDTGFFPSS